MYSSTIRYFKDISNYHGSSICSEVRATEIGLSDITLNLFVTSRPLYCLNARNTQSKLRGNG